MPNVGEPLSDQQIAIWKKKAGQPDYGSAFFKPVVVARLIEAYEILRAERDALQEQLGLRERPVVQIEMFQEVH